MTEAQVEAESPPLMTTPPILLVEDDHSQAVLVERVLRKVGLLNPVVAFHNGDEALRHFESERFNDAGAANLPALVLLDLHVPGKSGLDVLSWLKQQPEFEETPVIMLSGSTESEDIDRAFELGADSYLVKPVAFDALVDAVTGLGLPWVIIGGKRQPA